MRAVESEAKAKTKVRFEEIFRRHAGLADTKKSKNKKFDSQESIVLDTFRNNIDLSKESVNDEAIINNTYNPEEESPRFTKNKLREKASIAKKINNDVVSGEENKQPKSNRKKKKSLLQEQFNEEEELYEAKLGSFEEKTNDFPKKKTKSKSQTDVPQEGDRKIKNSLTEVRNVTELEEEEQLIQAYQLHVAEEEANAIKKKMRKKLIEQMSESTSTVQRHEVALKNEVDKKKKKKKERAVLSEAETSAMSLSELHHHHPEESGNESQSPERLFTSERQKLEESMNKQKTKAKKAKKKTRKEETTEVAAENDEEMRNSEISTLSKFGFGDDLVLGVYIHRSDRLKIDHLVSHPVVKIHIVDQRSGLYVKKEYSKKEDSSYEQEETEHILPIMTQPCDFRKSKSTIPDWEEQVIFDERFTYFIQNTEENPKVILFFELVGANGVLNVGGKLRLQLYYPPSRTKSHPNIVEVYDWWAKCPRNRYPSTLYVTVKGLKLPDHVGPFHSMAAVQQEQSNTALSELQKEGCEPSSEEKKEPFKWSRLPGQACRIPNKHLFSLRGGDMGCFCIRFSHDGRTLAAACAGRNGYPIALYEIPSGQFLREFYGHLNIVYDLCWSKDNQYLLTASSDGTVRMWKIETKAASAVRVFPHPSFVYTAKYHPVADLLVVTGCYDSVIRVWNANVKEIHGQLLQELDGHKSFINTLCFDAEGSEDGKAYVWNPETGDQVAIYSELSFTSPLRDVAFHPHEHMVSFCAFGQNHPILVYIHDYKVAQQEAELVRDLGSSLTTAAPRGPHFSSSFSEIPVQKNSVMSPADQFVNVARASMRMQKVKQKLDSVTANSNLLLPAPSSLSPHSKLRLPGTLSVPLNPLYSFTAESGVLVGPFVWLVKAPLNGSMSLCCINPSSQIFIICKFIEGVLSPIIQIISGEVQVWTPTVTCGVHHWSKVFSWISWCFSPVGNPLSRTLLGRLQKNDDSLTALGVGGGNSCPPGQETVVALYDYTAHRSDELTIHRSDIIQVLYKDNDNWWFGSLANGQQGYFPANYVAGEKEYEEQPSGLVPDSAPLLPEGPTEAEESSLTLDKMSAVTSKSGDLKFISKHDRHKDSPTTQGTKKKKKRIQRNERENQHNLMSVDTPLSSVTTSGVENEPTSHGVELKKKKKAARGSNLSTNGRTNIAFEPECHDAEA
ncbi:hypothetical protein DUI87_10488 [Hirundo rustica rustica]|uniref:SH3 domain-containing protein n=1 Tax=Hirundo rustica rustica TaxID=333673 RepID=A0A3M0KJZ1_HIRRU|nr:hypothetical protein DUI87_10488 [Hirundo rustica rustica]